jgi:hypothetical protein
VDQNLASFGQGMTDEAKTALLGQIGEIRSGANERFGKAGNTTTDGISTETGLVAINLEKPAKNLYSVWTRMRERIARTGNGVGLEATWRAITGIHAGGFDAGIAEGATGDLVQVTEEDKSAKYKTLGRLGQATFEAISAGRTFDDVVSLATLQTLQNLQVSEEISILAGCTTGVDAPGAIAVVEAATGTLTPTDEYDFAVSAVTLHGSDWINGTGARGHGVADSPNETDAPDAASHTMGAAKTSLELSWDSIPGAVAYNVYAAAHAAPLKFVAQVTVPLYTLKAIPVAGNAPNGANTTANVKQFDGILVQAALSGGASFVDLKGLPLTAGTGSVNEIDTALEGLFRGPKVGPSLLVVSGHEALTIRDAVLANGAASSQRFNAAIGDGGAITAGTIFMSYTNPFIPNSPIDVLAHPYLPQGTAMLITEKLPPTYPNANIETTWAMDCRREFYSIEYAIAVGSGRVKPVGAYVEEVLKGYFPAGTVVIQGIGA